MTRLTFFLLVSLLVFASCEKDNENESSTEILRLDGANFSSPSLPAGFYEHAVKFPTSLTSLYDGDMLTGVQVHFYDIPSDVEVVVYGPGSSADTPGPVVYSGFVSGLQANAVNNIDFAPEDAILIGRSDLWISIAYTISSAAQVIGCDAGPRDPNGDYLLENNAWTTFLDFTGTESINWNIRGIVTR